MAIYLNVLPLLIEFAASFILGLLILKKNRKSFTNRHLHISFIIFSLNFLFNIFFIISTENIEIYILMFRFIVVCINLGAIFLSAALVLVVWGETFYKKKIRILFSIIVVLIIIICMFYGPGVIYDENLDYHHLGLNLFYGWFVVGGAMLGLLVALIVSIYIILKVEKSLRKKLMFLSISIILLLIDIIILGLVNMRLIPFSLLTYSHILALLSNIMFYIWFFI